MSQMVICVATHRWEGWIKSIESWYYNAAIPYSLPIHIVSKKEILPAYQECYEHTTEPILAYLHDDLLIYERGWEQRVLKEFDDAKVGLVGIAGALGHGHPDLYHGPYYLPRLARQNFLSNLRDWQIHGERLTAERTVAVLDGMAVIVRRELLDKLGGWPVDSDLGYHLYTEWLCCMAHRWGYKIRLVGIEAEHLGGKTSTLVAVKQNYEKAHRLLYDSFQDVLPYRVDE
jgi:hypothetical protein